MPNTLVVESSLATSMFATPNNYGVTHIAIDSLPNNVAWSEAALVRKYAGYPQNINDGDTIHRIYNTDAILRVSFLNALKAINCRLDDGSANTTVNNTISSGPSGTSIDVKKFIRQSDGKLFIAGRFDSFNGIDSFGLARLNADNTLDTAFSVASGSGIGTSNTKWVNDAALQSDGKIIIGGAFTSFSGTTANRLTRLNSNGTLDTTFNAALGTGFNNEVKSVVLQSDGKIVIGGVFTSFNGTTANRFTRLNSDGTLDTTFNSAVGTGFNGDVNSIVIQPDGKFLVGGNFTSFNATTANRFTKLNSNGTLDTTFNTSLGTCFNAEVKKLFLQSDGKILVGGSITTFKGSAIAPYFTRLNNNGTLDTAFNTALGIGFDSATTSIDLQSDGKILVGGSFSLVNGNYTKKIAKLTTTGSIDFTFLSNIYSGSEFNNTVTTIFVNNDDTFFVGGTFGDFSGTKSGIGGANLITTFDNYQPLYENLGLLDSYKIGSCIGSDAKFIVSSTSVIVSPDNPGQNYAVNDLVTVRTSALAESSQPNEFGLSGYYHVYDTVGTDQGSLINPGVVTASEDAQNIAPSKVYYSLFIKYYKTYSDTQINSGRIWKKAAEASSFIVKNTGTVDTLAKHLPTFYLRDSQTDSGNDLLDFLKVFAFQLDLYKTEISGVFYNTKVSTSDEALLKLLLKEFGVNYADVADLSQARTLAANIIKIYKESGSIVGLQSLIEAYTGYDTKLIYGTNTIPDYSTSSFSDNVGYWTPGEVTGSRPSIKTTGPYEVLSGSRVAAFSNGQPGYGRLDDTVTGATCTTGSTTVTGTFGSDLKVGSALSVTSTAGTGVLLAGTVVTSILSTNTFRINFPPSTSLANATLRASTNTVIGMGKISWEGSATSASFVIGPKKSSLSTTVSGTNVINIAPGVAAVDDYIIHPMIPYGTYVTNVASGPFGTQSVTLSKNVTVTSTATAATFSRTAGEKIGSLSAWLPIQENKPYSFSFFYNSGEAISGAAFAQVSGYFTFRDREGNVVGSMATGSIYSSIVSTSNGNTGTWRDVVAQGVAPATAIYAEPTMYISSVSSAASWYVDGIQFNNPVKVVQKQIVASTTAKLTTSTEHKFYASRYGTSGANYVYVTGLGEPYDGQHPIISIDTPTSFTFSLFSATSTTPASTADGLVVSNPPYEEARKTIIDVLPNRINLVTNPSFEVSTNFWGTATVASTNAGVNCTITSTNATSIYGGSSLRMTSTSTSPMSVFGYAGQIVSGIITNYLAPFKVDSSSASEDSFYTLSFYTKAATVARDCYAELYWYQDEACTIPSAIQADETGTTETNSTSSWTRYSVTGKVPSDAKYANLEVHILSSVSGEVHYVDSVLLEKGYLLEPYFDGSFDGQNYTEDRDSMWETGGTPNLCRSHFYLNRVANSGKLNNIIVDGLYYA